MSGGYLEFAQYRMSDAAIRIDKLIEENDSIEKNDWGCDVGRHYPPEVIEKFKEASHAALQTGEMIEQIDALISGDKGEKSFLFDWNEEVRDCYKGGNSSEC